MPFRLPELRFHMSPRFIVLLTLILAGLTLVTVAQIPTTIYTFATTPGDVAVPTPYGVTAQGRDGNIYGTTGSGGASSAGGVYVMTPAGTETVLYSFPQSLIGCQPGLSLGSDGNFYGDCLSGGPNGYGLLYRITPTGTFTDLHDFSNAGGDGGSPNGPPVSAKDGNLYGTTQIGGANGDGTVFKLTPSGTLTYLYSFKGSDGANPAAPLVQGSDGNLYGSTVFGGSNGAGVIFKISTAGQLTALHNFNFTDGSGPIGGLVQGLNGSFYGTTYQGGVNNQGTAFRLNSAGTYTLIHSFAAATDGLSPETAMVQATDGNFYGTTNPYLDTCDSIYKITPNGVFSIVYQFDGTSSTLGIGLANGLIQNTNGVLYGATNASVTGGNGTVYTLNVGAHPFARLASTSGIVGSSVGIFGQGFSGASAVKFAGVTAPGVALQGTTYLTVPVPAGLSPAA